MRDFVAERGAVGCDQFMYWDPSDPRQCLAPDLLVRLGAAPGPFPIWKTWENGAPHLAIEIVSFTDRGKAAWRKKFEHYRRSGVSELGRFDAEDSQQPLRLWDRVDGDLVERNLVGEHALLCDTLALYWCVRSDAKLGRVLRLSHDALGQSLVLTAEERALELERATAARERAALARIAELEAALRGR